MAVLGLAVAVPAVHAQESRDDKFSAWDANRDGRLEMGEMQQNQANFRAMDCNRDGYLSRAEFTNRYQCDENNANANATAPAPAPVYPNQDEFWRLDSNRDGSLTAGEWVAGTDQFRRYDRNNDGRVTRDEYGNPLDPNSAEGRFQIEDLNNDGVISRPEWRSSRSTFDAMDLDRNGVLSLAEYSNTASNPATWQARFDTMDRNRGRRGVPLRVARRDGVLQQRRPQQRQRGDPRRVRDALRRRPRHRPRLLRARTALPGARPQQQRGDLAR
jgi:hypothetical protein